MSLTDRLSSLVLSVLGIVLIGLSTALYIAVHLYLSGQVNDRLDAALDVLTAAAEVHPDGVEWEPQERLLPLGGMTGPDQLRWYIEDEQGRRIDQSLNLDDADLMADWTSPLDDVQRRDLSDRAGGRWRVASRRIHPGPRNSGSVVARDQKDDLVVDPPVSLYPVLTLKVCAPLGPSTTALKSLLLLLIGLSLVVWLATAFFCRRLAHRALEPLRRLASSARGLDAADPGWSLDRIGTGDELDELSQAINDLLARLHLAYERQRRISSDASHQLRTPLTVLIGQIEVALRHDRSVEEYRRVLNSARARAVQLAQIVEALLFLGRSEGEADQPRGEPIDLNSWVASHIASRSQTDLTSVVSYRATQPEPLPVQFHPTLLAQLLENLIDNALKHGRSVAGPSIRVETGREGATAWLAVEDDGPGISPDDADRIFEPFYRSALARRNGIAGTGLGLPVVRRIATAFGGVVLLQPKRGAGCRFEVRLPLLEETGEATWSNRLSQAGSAERTETPAMALRRSLKE